MKHLCKEQDCGKCEQYYSERMYDDWDEGCCLQRDIFEPCYLTKPMRRLYSIKIKYREWKAERRIKKDDKKRIKLGYSEEEWFWIKYNGDGL